MSKRLAGPDELPHFGSVWAWEDGEPMMAVCDVDENPGLPRSWLFLRLLDKRDPLVRMWVGANETSEWVVLDD